MCYGYKNPNDKESEIKNKETTKKTLTDVLKIFEENLGVSGYEDYDPYNRTLDKNIKFEIDYDTISKLCPMCRDYFKFKWDSEQEEK